MALVDKTRKLKQSNCAFVYGLIKDFTYFYPIRSQIFLNAIPRRQKQFLLGTANGRSPGVMK